MQNANREFLEEWGVQVKKKHSVKGGGGVDIFLELHIKLSHSAFSCPDENFSIVLTPFNWTPKI